MGFSLSSSEFLRLLSENGLTHQERAVGLIWFHNAVELSGEVDIRTICSALEQAGYSKQNISRLKKQLAGDRRVLKNKEGYRINPLRLPEVEVIFSGFASIGTDASLWNNDIYRGLLRISQKLAFSYKQAKIDLISPEGRVSWAGTAHEIRQLLSSLLKELSPDSEVSAQKWYKQTQETSGPTQAQRVRYALQKSGASLGIGEQASLDNVVAQLTRSIYSEASDAAHTYKSRAEAKRLMHYAEAIISDLLAI